MIAVNDAYMKYLFDNRYGTGQSVWDGIMRTTNLVVAGKTVVVSGYGWCGKGVARRAEGLGAQVIVTEVDPVAANEALMDGYSVLPMSEAAPRGDFFITVTGCKNVIRGEHYENMKDGAVLANAGHFDVEISKPDLEEVSVDQYRARENITAYELQDGRRIYLLAEGRLVNLAAADGHPAEVMDMSFAVQALALQYLNEHKGELEPGVVDVTRKLDEEVARLRLEALGVELDSLNDEQVEYLQSWQVGE
jgi:adenosylhomocysteinase